jgi:alkanesulfonate monooxygenase SsuD/methylene tetrahydromethanopterin reductase-like flavin-dependent oxidoreductase (luciferase family)
MRYGISCPNFADPLPIVELAITAEEGGWDGFFLWDHINFLPDVDIPLADPWVTLGAAAARTVRLRLGPMVTPLPRRRPWKVARESVTLDRLSRGRAVLGVGAGWPAEGDFAPFGEPSDLPTRARQLDEALAVVSGLWSGEPFAFDGAHYQLSETTFTPRAVQQPRIPIWVAATWPHPAPLRRACRWDGVVPLHAAAGQPWAPQHVSQLVDRCLDARGDLGEFDVVLSGIADRTAGGRQLLAEYEEAGATWWLETTDGMPGWWEEFSRRVAAGPPDRA